LAIEGHAEGVASNFDGAVFTNCDLTGAKLTPALLQKAKFRSIAPATAPKQA